MAPIPESIVSHQQSCVLELVYAQDKRYKLSYEFLRVHSPSAEVQGHGPGQQVLQTGKREVRIVSLSPTATEMLYAVGAGAQVVAVDEYSNYPQEAVDLGTKVVTVTGEGLDRDAIVAAIGDARVNAIVCTHTHRDHSPAAAELKARLKAWKPRAPKETRGVLAKYARTVTSASEGAVTARKGASPLAADLPVEVAILSEAPAVPPPITRRPTWSAASASCMPHDVP